MPKYSEWVYQRFGQLPYEQYEMHLNSRLVLRVMSWDIGIPKYSAEMLTHYRGRFDDRALIYLKKIKGLEQAKQAIEDAARKFLSRAASSIPPKR